MHHYHDGKEHSTKEVLVVPIEEHERLEELGIPHKKKLKAKYVEPSEINNFEREVTPMHTTELELDLNGNCGYGHCGAGIGAGVVGGLVGGAIAGRRGFGYGDDYGYGYNRGVSVGDMYGAAETNKVGHTVARDIWAADNNINQRQLMGDFATLNKINDSDLKNAIAHMSLAKDICDVKTSLKEDILENRHLAAMEHCKTRELTLKETGAILCKMAEDREQALRDELLMERTKCNRAQDTIVQNQIITGLENLDGRIEQIVYKIVNGGSN